MKPETCWKFGKGLVTLRNICHENLYEILTWAKNAVSNCLIGSAKAILLINKILLNLKFLATTQVFCGF